MKTSPLLIGALSLAAFLIPGIVSAASSYRYNCVCLGYDDWGSCAEYTCDAYEIPKVYRPEVRRSSYRYDTPYRERCRSSRCSSTARRTYRYSPYWYDDPWTYEYGRESYDRSTYWNDRYDPWY